MGEGGSGSFLGLAVKRGAEQAGTRANGEELVCAKQRRLLAVMHPWVAQLCRESRDTGTAKPEVPELFLHTPFFREQFSFCV